MTDQLARMLRAARPVVDHAMVSLGYLTDGDDWLWEWMPLSLTWGLRW